VLSTIPGQHPIPGHVYNPTGQRRHPRPIKHVQLKAMTVCIAAKCLMLDGSRGFVLCADTKVSGGIGVSDSTDKIYPLGRNYVALMAGPPPVFKLAEFLSSEIDLAAPNTEDDLFKCAKQAGKRLTDSDALFPRGSDPCYLLVTGFGGSGLVMMEVTAHEYEDERLAYVGFQYLDNLQIGSGAELAKAMLSLRKHTAVANLDRTVYRVYEAKRFSEQTDGVGAGTQIMIHSPMHANANPRADLCRNYLSSEALSYLESLRGRFFVQDISIEEEFPLDFYRGRYPFRR
jgi:hypothetical protein